MSSELPGRLGKVLKNLERIFVESDEQFNRISDKLQQFYQSSNDITGLAVTITDNFSSIEYQQAISGLKKVFENVFVYLSSTHQSLSISETSLKEINRLLLQAFEGVTGFNKICRHLEMQSISIKIESSRLGNDDKGFSHLSDDIHKLAELISKQANGFKEKAKGLINTTANVEKQVEALKNSQEENSKTIDKSTRQSLEILTKEFELSGTKSASIHFKAEGIKRGTGSLVTSVQFHVITRQQMEHVYKIIGELLEKIHKAGSFNEEDSSMYTYIYNICRLQSAQLKNSKDELFSAVSEIINDHELIKNDVLGIAKDGMSLVNSDCTDRDMFINRVSDGLEKIVNRLKSNEKVQKEFTGSVENVIRIIEELSGFVNEINSIGSEIELLSLNANIKAAHTGSEGASLGVLAEAIQRLSSDSNDHTNSVISILLDTQKVSNELKANTTSENNSLLNSFSEDIAKVFKTLNSLTEESVKALKHIQKASSELNLELHKSIDNLKRYLKVKTKLEEIIDDLDLIVNKCEKFIDNSKVDNEAFNSIGKNYTMKVQRDIHNSISAGETTNDYGTDISDQITESQCEFGENVELF